MNLNQILRKIILVGLFVVPFIPLYVAGTMFFPFITGKNFVFRIIVEIVFAAWVILLLRDKKYLPQKSIILYSLTGFVLVLAIADIFGANLYRSFWSNYERMEGFIAHLHLFGYFLVLSSLLDTEKLWNRFLKTILGVGVAIVFYALAQMAGFVTINQGAMRVDATFGNATYLAIHMLFLIFIAAFYFLRARINFKTSQWVYLLLVFAYLYVLYGTATRGAVVGLIAGILVSVLPLLFWGQGKSKKWSVVILSLVIVLVLAFIPARKLEVVKKSQMLGRFAELSLDNVKKESRFMVWGMALEGFKERPILGWGQDNFNLVFNKYYNPGMYSQEPWFDRAHDVFFDWLVAGGILGLLSYLSIFAAGVYTVWKKTNKLNFTIEDKALFTGLFTAYFVQNIFVFDNLISYTMFFTILAYLHHGSIETPVLTNNDRGNTVGQESVDYKIFYTFVSSLVVAGLFFSVYFWNIKPILTSRQLIKALASPDLVQGLQFFKQALAYNTFGSIEGREQLTQRAVQIRNLDNVDNKLKLEYFSLAKEEMTKQITAAPDDVRYQVFLTTLLSGYGALDEALVGAEKMIQMSPKKQQLLFELAALHLNRKEYDKALEVARRAYELEPNFNEAAKIYALVAIYNRREKEKEFQNIFDKYFGGSDTPADDRFINAYAAQGRYDKTVEIWKKKVVLDPNNPQFHVSLAGNYLANGQRSLAINELREAIKLNPQFKETGENFIREIQAGRNP